MAFKWNVRDGAIVSRDVYGVRVAAKIGILSGFTPTDSENALDEAVVEAITQSGFGYNTAYPGDTSQCQVLEITATPADQNFVILYEFGRPGGAAIAEGSTNSLYVVSEDWTQVTVERVTIPHVNDGEPIYVGWKNPDDETQVIAPQLCRFRIQKPAKQIVIAGWFDVAPSFTGANGLVNSTAFRGLERGFWLCAGMAIRRAPKQVRRYVQIVLLTLLDEDWSTYSVVEHPNGISPAIDTDPTYLLPGYPANDSGGTAPNGHIVPTGLSKRESMGIVKIGPFLEIDFNTQFAAIDTTGE